MWPNVYTEGANEGEWSVQAVADQLPFIRKIKVVDRASMEAMGNNKYLRIVTKSGALTHKRLWMTLPSFDILIGANNDFILMKYYYPWMKYFHPHPTIRYGHIGTDTYTRVCIGEYAKDYLHVRNSGPYQTTLFVLGMIQAIEVENKRLDPLDRHWLDVIPTVVFFIGVIGLIGVWLLFRFILT